MAIILCWTLTVQIALRKQHLTCMFVYCLVSTISLTILFLNFNGLLIYEDYVGMPIAYDYERSDYYITLGIVIPQIIASYMLCTVVFRRNSFSFIKVRQFLKSNLAKVTKFGYFIVVFILSFLLLAALAHFIDIDKALFWANGEYLLLVQPERVGLSNGFTAAIHHVSGLLSVLALYYCFFCYSRKRRLFSFLFFTVFFYFFLLKVAQLSRWGFLISASFVFFFYVFANMKKINNILFFAIMIVFTWLMYNIPIAGRGSSLQGLSGFFHHLVNIETDVSYNLELLYFFFSNVFGGHFVTVNAVGMPANYPVLFKVLSFSFLPSAIDGFHSVKQHYHFVNQYVPFNVYAELYHFGYAYYFLFLGLFSYFQYYISKLYIKRDYLPYVLLLSCFTFVTFFMQYYGLRNCWRFLVIPLILVAIFKIIKRSKKRD